MIMTAEELHAFLVREFPQSDPEWMRIEQVGERYVRVRAIIGESDLRPGGTVSGTALMSLADLAMYLCVVNEVGNEPLSLATSHENGFRRLWL